MAVSWLEYHARHAAHVMACGAALALLCTCVELCLQDPWHEVNIVVSCSLIVMTSIWICQRTLEDALRSGDIRILGESALTGRLQKWLRASGLAALGERGDTPTLLSEGIVS